MLEKFKRAWTIAKMCWRVLRLDKELLVFPILSLVTCGLLLASVVGPLWASGQLEVVLELVAGSEEEGFGITTIAFDFAVYFVACFVMIFFNAALIACAKIRFAGGDPTVADGLRASIQRLPQIFVWSLTTSVVGFFLSRMASADKGIGKYVFAFLGAGWAIASFFVVPVLVSEKVGPIAALKKSVSVIKKTWGELLIAEVGMSMLVAALIVFPSILLVFLGLVILEFAPAVSISIFVFVAIWVFATSLAYSTLSAILRTALYLYATEGSIPKYFDPDVIRNP